MWGATDFSGLERQLSVGKKKLMKFSKHMNEDLTPRIHVKYRGNMTPIILVIEKANPYGHLVSPNKGFQVK